MKPRRILKMSLLILAAAAYLVACLAAEIYYRLRGR